MQLLYKCGYWRATVLTQNDLGNCFFQVVFVNAIVQLPGPNAVLRMTPAWPIAPDVIQKSQPFFCMPQAIAEDDCIIKFAISLSELERFFRSGNDVLSRDPAGHDFPATTLEALKISQPTNLDDFDRIFTCN